MPHKKSETRLDWMQQKVKILLTSLILFTFFIISIDQILFFTFNNKRAHVLFHMGEDEIFRSDDKHDFLLRPDAASKLWQLGPKVDPKHQDYTLNDKGMRQSVEVANLKRKRTINLFGDSFTFGLFLKESETFAHYLNQESEICRFLNYGVPAFSLHDMLNLAQDSSLINGGDSDIFIFITDDIYRIFRPIEVHRLGRTVDVGLLKRKFFADKEIWAFNFPKTIVSSSFTLKFFYQRYLNEIWTQVRVEQILLGMKKWQEKNAIRPFRFIHIPVPHEFIYDSEEKNYRLNLPSAIKAHSLTPFKESVLFPNEILDYYFKGDNHPSPKGARWIADGIKKQLQAECF